ncbi:MAG TPA: M1 family aminopeptidase, partial [Pyrinomonadaceae bacterium]|nr:M1 family aminopeptidase [Pyrinomonadaceae bacterium]
MLRRLSLLVTAAVSIMACSKPASVEPGVSHTLAQWRAARYSDVHYKLDLTLEKMSPQLKGTLEIRVNVAEPTASSGGTNLAGKSSQIILDWRKIRGSESLSTVSNVIINGTPVSLAASAPPADGGGSAFEYNEHLVFRDGVAIGENVIKLDFTSPILTSGSAVTRYVDKEDGAEYVYSLFVPSDASTAFPVFDQPDLKARFSLTVSRPDDWKVVSNSVASGGEGQPSPVLFTETQPISTYVFAFAAGPWEQVAQPPASTASTTTNNNAVPQNRGATPPLYAGSSVFVRKSQAAKFKPYASEVFRLNGEGIKFLEEYFEYKFPFPKYDLVLIPEFPFGGMEHAGATFLREDRIIFPQEPTKNDHISRANLIFHEAAHQWFGDTVTMRW